MQRILWVTLMLWAVVLLGLSTALAAEKPVDSDELALRALHQPTDGPALLEYLRKQTAIASNKDKLEALIRSLGDDSFAVREKASADLIALGRMVLPLLNQAKKDPDLEIVRRAEHCIQIIERNSQFSISSAIVRLVAVKQPQGAAEVLLAYLPHADNASSAEEIRVALASVALREGRPDPVFTAALSDKSPLRRGAAADALIRAGDLTQRDAVLKLMADEDASVRLLVCLSLARQKEKRAIPVLIELLGQMPAERLWQAEDLLLHLAGDQAPAVALGDDAATRKKCRNAWAAWWHDHGEKLDIAKLEVKPTLGFTLVVLLDQNLIMELDKDKKPRWQIKDVQFPLDVQMIPGERVLVAEMQGGRVTERNRKGEILWEHKIDAPLMAQRLPNGNTFIANREEVVEVDRAGKHVFTHSLANGDTIMRAQKLRNGSIALVTNARRFILLDKNLKETCSFEVNVQTSGGRVEVLPNGHVLIPEMNQNAVTEYDTSGKKVWEATVDKPVAATRLANGNTLVTTMVQNRAVEITRAGKEVWEFKADSRVTRAIRR